MVHLRCGLKNLAFIDLSRHLVIRLRNSAIYINITRDTCKSLKSTRGNPELALASLALLGVRFRHEVAMLSFGFCRPICAAKKWANRLSVNLDPRDC